MSDIETKAAGMIPLQIHLRRAFCLCVLCLACFQFSENTADPDLWAHVMFGEHFLQSGEVMKSDPYSWTARGHEWINHEVLAEAALGLAHRWLGGTGLLLLKMLTGLLTFGIALFLATREMRGPARLMAWAFGALAVVEISFGFAVRPQIFSALALVLQLWITRQIHCGRWGWALALPPLFMLWVNTHGGVLAGLLLLLVTAGATTLQYWLIRSAPAAGRLWLDQECLPRTILVLWLSLLAAASATLINPWGFGLVRWLVASVLWLRPEITEWNATPFDGDHLAFFACALFTVIAFTGSRRPRSLWQISVTLLLGLMAFRSVRHAPLFCLAALALVPPHLADVLQRFRHHFERLEERCRQPLTQKILTLILLLSSAGILAATGSLHKQRAWTMEVPLAEYPVSAIKFIRDHELHGNLLVYFDWGEMCLWELPDSAVSLDGRLDTCYPREVISAQWKFYNDNPPANAALWVKNADYALLPVHLAGAGALMKKYGWTPVYFDGLAVVLVKYPEQFAKLTGLTLPLQGGPEATQGREPFPQLPPPQIPTK